MKYSSTNFPTIATERLMLRSITPLDIDTLFILRSHEGVIKYINRPPARTTEEVEAFYEMISSKMAAGENVNWALSLPADGAMIGTICLWNYSADRLKAEVGYDLLPTYHGKGYMTEALTAVLDFGFATMGFKHIEAYTSRHNEASKNLLAKHSFVWQPERHDKGDLNNHIFCCDRKSYFDSKS